MDNRKYNHTDPWDEGIFETGRTDPPKSRGGLIAVLLILVIFLSGITCVLGVLNVRLSRKLDGQSQEDFLSFSFSEGGTAAEWTPDNQEKTPTPENRESISIELETPPEPESAQTTDEPVDWSDVYEQNIPSVVSISCVLPRGSSTGTGVVLTKNGYIVTNCHVVENATQITVLLTDNRTFYATVVGADAITDLAVLYIDAQDLIPAQFGDSSTLRVGERVVAIGDPLGIEFRGTMTDGIVSAINRDITVEGRTMTLIQTNAALNSGNSGGPLINRYGQVIGINTMKISAFVDQAGVEGLGFAIPSATVKDIVDQLMTNGYVSGRPTLGLTGESLTMFYRYYYRLPEGLYITQVAKNGPADRTGIVAGDILISVNGTRVLSQDMLNSILFAHEIGDTLDIVIYRGGKQYSAQITLAEDQG